MPTAPSNSKAIANEAFGWVCRAYEAGGEGSCYELNALVVALQQRRLMDGSEYTH